MIQLDNLEQLLIKNWTEFIEVKPLINHLLNIAVIQLKVHPSSKVKKVSATRFEFSKNGFVVWFDFSIDQFGKEIKCTSEFYLTSDGIKNNQITSNT